MTRAAPARGSDAGLAAGVGHQRAVRRVDRAGQHRAAGQVRVHPGGRGAALGDRPHDQRLPAAHVAGREHPAARWS